MPARRATARPPAQAGGAEQSALPGDAKLQGWAIVENQTDNDWNDVQLSLVSGRPISFIQDLYQPLYVPRPVVQPELYASLRPQTYDAGMNSRRARRRSSMADAGGETAAGRAPARPGRQRRRCGGGCRLATAFAEPTGGVDSAGKADKRCADADGRHRLRRLRRVGRQGRRAVPVHRRQRHASRARSRR